MHTSIMKLIYLHNELYMFRPTMWQSSGIQNTEVRYI